MNINLNTETSGHCLPSGLQGETQIQFFSCLTPTLLIKFLTKRIMQHFCFGHLTDRIWIRCVLVTACVKAGANQSALLQRVEITEGNCWERQLSVEAEVDINLAIAAIEQLSEEEIQFEKSKQETCIICSLFSLGLHLVTWI